MLFIDLCGCSPFIHYALKAHHFLVTRRYKEKDENIADYFQEVFEEKEMDRESTEK